MKTTCSGINELNIHIREKQIQIYEKSQIHKVNFLHKQVIQPQYEYIILMPHPDWSIQTTARYIPVLSMSKPSSSNMSCKLPISSSG